MQHDCGEFSTVQIPLVGFSKLARRQYSSGDCYDVHSDAHVASETDD